MNKLIINIPYQQKVEISIEFPLEVLGDYNGISNIDETWDDNIMPIIQTALLNCGFNLTTIQLEFTNENKLLWVLSLIVDPPSIDFNGIVNDLSIKKFQKGILIKLKINQEDYSIIYRDDCYS